MNKERLPLFYANKQSGKLHIAMFDSTKVLCGGIVVRVLRQVTTDEYDRPLANRCRNCFDIYQTEYT